MFNRRNKARIFEGQLLFQPNFGRCIKMFVAMVWFQYACLHKRFVNTCNCNSFFSSLQTCKNFLGCLLEHILFSATKFSRPSVLQFSFSDGTNFPATCAAVPFFSTAPKFSIHVFCSFFPTAPKFSGHVCCSSFFSDRTKIFHSPVPQLFFSDGTNFSVTCSAVPFFPTTPKFSSHVCCSAFFSDRTKIFHSRVLQLFFFSTAPKFFSHVCCCSFFPTAQIFQPRVAPFKQADISTTTSKSIPQNRGNTGAHWRNRCSIFSACLLHLKLNTMLLQGDNNIFCAFQIFPATRTEAARLYFSSQELPTVQCSGDV